MSANVTTVPAGNIQVPLPLKNADELPNNQSAVLYRTKNSLNKVKSKPHIFDKCIQSMQKSIDSKHVEQINETDPSPEEAKHSGYLSFQ